MKLKTTSIFALVIYLWSVAYAFAMDINCVVGSCENKENQGIKEEDLYECVCPPADTFETILNIFGVLTLPFQFFSTKPNFYTAGSGLEGLIKKGCKCRLKAEKKEETTQQTEEIFQQTESNNEEQAKMDNLTKQETKGK